MTEDLLIQGCLRNEASAQQELYHRYSPKMLSVCYRYAKSREDAEDMLQEGFIKVFTQIHQFQNRGALEGWIRRIIVHTCINNLKKNKKFSDSVDIIHAASVPVREENIPSILQAKQVVECIRLLPMGYRTVLNLYAIEGYSHPGYRRKHKSLPIYQSKSHVGRYPSQKEHPYQKYREKRVVSGNSVRLKASKPIVSMS